MKQLWQDQINNLNKVTQEVREPAFEVSWSEDIRISQELNDAN